MHGRVGGGSGGKKAKNAPGQGRTDALGYNYHESRLSTYPHKSHALTTWPQGREITRKDVSRDYRVKWHFVCLFPPTELLVVGVVYASRPGSNDTLRVTRRS